MIIHILGGIHGGVKIKFSELNPIKPKGGMGLAKASFEA